jgi:XTP/dITP diphosphohydrolase
VSAPVKLFLASSNTGKLGEFRALTQSFLSSASIKLELLPQFDSLPPFEESAPSFAENAAGKALYYSRLTDGVVFADDSGLVVPALGGKPGVQSARYAGPQASSAERNSKLLGELHGKTGEDRAGHFVCAIALARRDRTLAVITARVDGIILESPRGSGGFGYDPVFLYPPIGKTFGELPAGEKNLHSHRGKAFLKLLEFVADS